MRSPSLAALAVGTWWLMAVSPAVQADVFRWDNGKLIPGTEGITPGPGVQLDHLELEYAELSNQNLTDSSFDVSNLRYADLYQSNLTNASLTAANLTSAVLGSSTLTNVNLTGAVVTGAQFYDTTPRGFTKEQLYSTASYQQQNLQAITLGYNDLSGWDLSGQGLTSADLSSSTLTNVNLAGAVVTGAQFYDTTSRGFTKEQLYSTASYQQKNLQAITLGYNDLSGWDLSGQDLTNANLFQSTLTDATLTGANLTNAYLDSSTLTNAKLAGANLAIANLSSSTLTNANLSGAVVTGAQFYDTTSRGFTKEQLYSTASYQQKNLQRIGLWGNDLSGWDFSGQDLSNATLYNTTLTDANLTNANLAGANLTNAVLYGSTLTNADFAVADTRGAQGLNLTGAISRNAILPDATIAVLDLVAGERLVVRDYAGDPSQGLPPNVVTVVGGMSIAATGQLDLGHSSLIVKNGSLANVTALVASGAAGLAWNGPGIASSAAATDPNLLTALGVMLNDDGLGGSYYTTFAGPPVMSSDVLVKYTYYGDADLSGIVDGTDYALIDNGFNSGFTGWFNGDFDYSGLIDGTDYALIDNAFNAQGAPLGGLANVPEPSALALCALGLILGLALRRRRYDRGYRQRCSDAQGRRCRQHHPGLLAKPIRCLRRHGNRARVCSGQAPRVTVVGRGGTDLDAVCHRVRRVDRDCWPEGG